MAGSPATRLVPDLPDGSRAALVVATTRYEDPELDQLRAPAHDAKNLAEVLGDPGIGAFDVTQVIDADERRVRREIDVFLSGRGIGDLVVVYLSCHGVLDRRNRLYFAAADTLKTQLGSTGIPSAWLMDELEECRARTKVLILDCCFSGAFAHGSKGDGDLDLERRLAGQGRGQAVLTASRAGEYSFEGEALPGAVAAESVFTAGLVEGLRTGAADVGGDGYVSVDEAFNYASAYVLSKGASQTPQRWLYGGEGSIVLARSPAGAVVTPAPMPEALAASLDNPYPAVRIGAVNTLGEWLTSADPSRALTAEQKLRQIADTDVPAVAAAARGCLLRLEPVGTASAEALAARHDVRADGNAAGETAQEVSEAARIDRARITRVLTDAERIAQSITDESLKAEAFASIAEKLAAADPDRATRLGTDAVRIAQSITDESLKAEAFASIAEKLAAADPDRATRLGTDAVRIAQSITSESSKARALASIAIVLAAADPDRAIRIARSITSESLKAGALASIAKGLAAADPDRATRLGTDAERIARSITSESLKDGALASIAEGLAAADPDRAERIAQSITSESLKDGALASIARALAAADPDRAERIARSITSESLKDGALASIAEGLAAADPDRAERIARSITSESLKDGALARIARALADADPDRAERIARSITSESSQAGALASIAAILADADPDRATRLGADAERTARYITSESSQAGALASIAVILAAADPDSATRLGADAERIARSITSESSQAGALASIAVVLAAADPDRAERIAQSITSESLKDGALARIAWVLAADPDRAERIAQSITDESEKVRALVVIAAA